MGARNPADQKRMLELPQTQPGQRKIKLTKVKLLFCLIPLGFLFIFLLYLKSYPFSGLNFRPVIPSHVPEKFSVRECGPEDVDGIDCIDVPKWTPQKPPKHRVSFNHDYNVVRCMHSTTGYWFANYVTPVELDFLGLDRFVPQNRSLDSQDEEDAFCDRLQLIGPLKIPQGSMEEESNFWTELYSGSFVRDRYCWPMSGGAWVRKFFLSEDDSLAREYYDDEEYKLVGAIKNALTMEERCQAFERAGAKFCAKLEDCEETRRFTGMKIWPNNPLV